MQFTINQYINAIKYHNHQYDKTNLEMLEDIKEELIDRVEIERDEITEEFEKEIEEKNDIIYDQDQTISELEEQIRELEDQIEEITEAINSGKIQELRR